MKIYLTTENITGIFLCFPSWQLLLHGLEDGPWDFLVDQLFCSIVHLIAVEDGLRSTAIGVYFWGSVTDMAQWV